MYFPPRLKDGIPSKKLTWFQRQELKGLTSMEEALGREFNTRHEDEFRKGVEEYLQTRKWG